MTEHPSAVSTAHLRSRLRQLTVGLVAAGLSLGFLELLVAVLTVVVNPLLTEPIPRRGPLLAGQSRGLETLINDSEGREEIHPVLGWRYRPELAAGPDTINSAGLRTSREYALTPSEGTIRIAAFGDSFVYCNEVANPACWTSILEANWNAEVLNYGVGGYGTDQAFLRYLEDGRALLPDLVLIGFAPVNLRRIVNRYRRFISSVEGPWFKPRFILANDTLSLVPSPVRSTADAERLLADPHLVTEIGEMDHWYEPALYEHRLYRWSPTYRLVSNVWMRVKRRFIGQNRLLEAGVFRTQSEAFILETAVLAAFADSVRTSGSRPVVLMLPSRTDLERRTSGEPPAYDPLKYELIRRGMEVIDPLQGFFTPTTPVEDFFRPGGHYSLVGNEVIAREVAAFLSLDRS